MRRAQGRRKSEFVASTTVLPDAEFDFFVDGINYRITSTNFYSDLGVTGTIVQAGAVTGVPVLDKQKTVNSIRNLEVADDSGLQAAVSPENGITLAFNAQSTGTGVPVLSDANKIRRIKAGTDISVAASDDDIVIGASTTPGTSNVVNVDELADFPSPVTGLITLADNTIYFITANVDIGANTFRMGENTVITGLGSNVVGITSSGTAALFANADQRSNEVSGIKIDHPNGVVFEITSGGGVAEILADNLRIVECSSVVSANGADVVRLNNMSIDLTQADVFTFSGANRLVKMEGMDIRAFTGTVFDLNSATFDRFFAGLIQITSNSGINLILDGLAAGANVAGGSGTMFDVFVDGPYLASSTILSEDIGWNFQDNNFIGDSVVRGLLPKQSSDTIAIASIGVPVKAGGTWIVEKDVRTLGDVGGRITYKGERSGTFNVMASLTISPVAGNNRDLNVYIAVNGVVETNSARGATVSSSSSSSVTVPWTVDLAPDDYIEVFVENNTSTDDIVVSSGVMRLG